MQRPVKRVAHGLRNLGIAGNHRRAGARVQHRAFRHDDFQRLQTALVQRDIRPHQRAENIQHHRPADRQRRVVIARVLRRGAGEIDHRLACRLIDAHLHPDLRPVVHRIAEFAVLQPPDHPAHAFLGIVLHVAHIGQHHLQPVGVDHLQDLAPPGLVGRHLRLQIGHVLGHVAAGIAPRQKQGLGLGLAQPAPVHQPEIVDHHAFLVQPRAVGRTRPRRAPADIGVMAARTQPEHHLATHENRGHHGDIRQMGAAVEGRIQHEGITLVNIAGVFADHRADAVGHRAQMHRHMRRVGHQIAGAVENRAGKIQPFLDVHRPGRVRQRHPHLFGDRHGQVVEHLQQHRVRLGPRRRRPSLCRAAFDDQVALAVQPRRPARLDHVGAGGLADHRRACHLAPRRQPVTVVNRHIAQIAAHPDRHRAFGRAIARGPQLYRRLARIAHRLDAQHLVKHRAFGRGEAEPRPVHRLKRFQHLIRAAKRHLQRLVRAVVAQMRPEHAFHPVHALVAHLGLGRRAQIFQHRRRARDIVKRRVELGFAQRPDLGQPHAIGRQHACERMHEHPPHPQRIGHQTGMLPPRAAETLQRIAGHVMAALHADFLDRIGHVVHRDAQEPLGQRLRAHRGIARGRRHLARQRLELFAHHPRIQRLIPAGAEDMRKMIRVQLAQHHVAIGHRQRPAAPVARGPRIGAGTFRPHLQTPVAERADRPAAGRHRVNIHHRRAHPHARDFGFETAFVFAGEMADIGAGAAHVKADQPVEPGLLRGLDHADDAPRGPAQDRVLALEQACVRQPAVGLHEQQPAAAPAHVQRARHLFHVAAQDRRKIGIHHRGIAPPHQLRQPRNLVADRHLGEPDLARDPGGARLVHRVQIAVQQRDRHRPDTVIERRLQACAQRGLVQRREHRARGIQPLAHLFDAFVKQLGPPDFEREQIRARLVADAQQVAKAACDQQQHAFALAFEQRIGGHGGAHLHRPDRTRRDRLARRQPEAIADALHGGVAVAFGVFRKQLAGLEAAIRAARHHVGKSAAPVHPEFPRALHSRPSSFDRHNRRQDGGNVNHPPAAAPAGVSYKSGHPKTYKTYESGHPKRAR